MRADEVMREEAGTKAVDAPRTLAELMICERQKRGLSLRGSAELIGISHTEISRIEKGKRQCPSLISLQMIARAYELDIGILTQFAADAAFPVQNAEKKGIRDCTCK